MAYLYPGSFASTWNNFYVLPWLCWAVCWQGPECTSWFCNLLPLSYRFGCLCSRSVMIQWNVIWDQSAVRRAVCQRAGRSQLGPPQLHWEPWHRAALVLSPHLVWAVKGVCALLWTWLWLILTWFPGLASDLAHPCGLTDLLAICCHCQTCSALLAWSLCLCPFSLLSLLPALLTFAPQAPQAPLQLLLCPAPGMDHRDFRMSETPGGNGQWCDRRDCYDNKENVALALLPFSFLNSQSEIQVYGHEPGCRESSRQEELAGHVAGSFPSTHRCRFQGHRFRSAFLGLSCRQTSSSRRQRKLLSIATEQPQWFILNSF